MIIPKGPGILQGKVVSPVELDADQALRPHVHLLAVLVEKLASSEAENCMATLSPTMAELWTPKKLSPLVPAAA
jgi:hypothetical protein